MSRSGSQASLTRRSNSHASRLSQGSHLSARSSTRYGFEQDEPGNTKPARVVYRNYFSSTKSAGINLDDVAIDGTYTIRVLKMDPEMSNLRASLVRWKKYKAHVVLGDGRLNIELIGKKTSTAVNNSKASMSGSQMVAPGKDNVAVRWAYEVGHIKNLAYKRKGAKEFVVSFVNDSKLVTVVTDSQEMAEKWIIAILAEVRALAGVFGTILKQVLNPVWLQLLKSDSVIQEELDGAKKLTSEEERSLIMPDEDTNVAETCLREEVDLWTLCRGADHPDVCDACERLSIWLKRNMRHEESRYWLEAALEGRKAYANKMKGDLNNGEVMGKVLEKTPMEELRNPAGGDHLFWAREQNSKIDFDKRVERVLRALKSGNVVEEADKAKEHDQMEDIL